MSGFDHDQETGYFMHLFLDAEMPGSPMQGHQFSTPLGGQNSTPIDKQLIHLKRILVQLHKEEPRLPCSD
jgi:hypothetical protein